MRRRDRTQVTFGIGASLACDGQLLVTEDLMGWTEGPLPRYMEPCLDMAGQIRQTARSFADGCAPGSPRAPTPLRHEARVRTPPPRERDEDAN